MEGSGNTDVENALHRVEEEGHDTESREGLQSLLTDEDSPASSSAPHVSPVRRFLLLLFASFQIFFTSGVVFGWSALDATFRNEGLYHDLCDKDTPLEDICAAQKNRLSLVYTLAVFAVYLTNVPFGVILDKYGPRVTGIIGGVFLMVGSLLIAFRWSLPFDSVLLGFLLIGLFGPPVQMATFHISNLYQYSRAVLALFTALFDASALVFLAFKFLVDETSLDLRTLFIAYAIAIAFFVVVATVLFFPKDSFKKEDHSTNVPQTTSALYDQPAKRQIFSMPMFFVGMFLTMHSLRLNFFIDSIHDQLPSFYSHEEAELIAEIFGLLLPLGFVGMPLVAYFLEKRTFNETFTFINILGVVWGACLVYPSEVGVVYPAIVVFSTVRQFCYSATIGYLASVFGYRNWGKAVATVNVMAAAGTGVQYGLMYIAVNVLNGRFYIMNAILLALAFPLFILPRDPHSRIPKLVASSSVDSINNLDEVEELPPSSGSSSSPTAPPSS